MEKNIQRRDEAINGPSGDERTMETQASPHLDGVPAFLALFRVVVLPLLANLSRQMGRMLLGGGKLEDCYQPIGERWPTMCFVSKLGNSGVVARLFILPPVLAPSHCDFRAR